MALRNVPTKEKIDVPKDAGYVAHVWLQKCYIIPAQDAALFNPTWSMGAKMSLWLIILSQKPPGALVVTTAADPDPLTSATCTEVGQMSYCGQGRGNRCTPTASNVNTFSSC
jgi:hypothetical protein